MNPTGYLHGIVESNFGRTLGILWPFTLGRVLVGEVGLYIAAARIRCVLPTSLSSLTRVWRR
jgi:hypothetical protein